MGFDLWISLATRQAFAVKWWLDVEFRCLVISALFQNFSSTLGGFQHRNVNVPVIAFAIAHVFASVARQLSILVTLPYSF